MCESRGNNTIFVQDECIDRWNCCNDEGSDGLCREHYWGWGPADDPTIPTCWPYNNECACTEDQAWAYIGGGLGHQCMPKDYCAHTFEKCPANQKFVRNECVPNSIWDYCCSIEYYDYWYDTTDHDRCQDSRSEFMGRNPDGRTRSEEDCWNYTGCICDDGYKWSDYRNPITGDWDWVCVPDDRCDDLKICKGDEDYVECPMSSESICIDNQVIWGVNHPSKVSITGKACLDPTCHCANGLVRDEYSGKACFAIIQKN